MPDMHPMTLIQRLRENGATIVREYTPRRRFGMVAGKKRYVLKNSSDTAPRAKTVEIDSGRNYPEAEVADICGSLGIDPGKIGAEPQTSPERVKEYFLGFPDISQETVVDAGVETTTYRRTDSYRDIRWERDVSTQALPVGAVNELCAELNVALFDMDTADTQEMDSREFLAVLQRRERGESLRTEQDADQAHVSLNILDESRTVTLELRGNGSRITSDEAARGCIELGLAVPTELNISPRRALVMGAGRSPRPHAPIGMATSALQKKGGSLADTVERNYSDRGADAKGMRRTSSEEELEREIEEAPGESGDSTDGQ